MSRLFEIVGDDFFKPLNSKYKNQYIDCLNIIYETYQYEVSYGVDREVIVNRLEQYFSTLNMHDMILEEESEELEDPRSQANMFLRKLREYGWVLQESDIRKTTVIMPDYAVSMVEALRGISNPKEKEYQGDIATIYSLLTSEELLNKPYPQVIQPVFERTNELFSGLKTLKVRIRDYIDAVTVDKE